MIISYTNWVDVIIAVIIKYWLLNDALNYFIGDVPLLKLWFAFNQYSEPVNLQYCFILIIFIIIKHYNVNECSN